MTRKTSLVLTTVLAALAATLLAAAPASGSKETDDDEAAIRRTVQLYFDGIIEYDEAKLKQAFHPDAFLTGIHKSGAFEREPFDEWVVYTRGDAPDSTGRNNEIAFIDIGGNAAVVKTELRWPHVHYTDYLSLLKIDGEWKIVHKSWQAAPDAG
ncbi:MAG: nuclear transport factor 2 family protein [Nitrospiraceae bacterium]|nr:nuclear transport factor 2 family protein [Nitrospiraceae bacterium]